MALSTLQLKPFRGSQVQATLLPQLLRRAVALAFSTSGQLGAMAEPSLTPLLPLLTGLTQRIS